MISEHFIEFGVNWATPVLLMAFASMILRILQIVFADYLALWGFSMTSKEIAVDEDLPKFFGAVPLPKGDELIYENSNMVERFGFMPNDPDTIEKLENGTNPKKPIIGTPWYQILSNPKYSSDF